MDAPSISATVADAPASVHSSLTGGAIAGIVVGAVAAAGLMALLGEQLTAHTRLLRMPCAADKPFLCVAVQWNTLLATEFYSMMYSTVNLLYLTA